MGSRQLGDRQMNFLARLYERGTGDSVPVTVSFQNDTLLIYLEENGNQPIAVALDEWEVKVGGSAEDKIVLRAHQTGDTLVCGDEHFLTCIAEATNHPEMLKQVEKAKKRNATRFVRQSSGMVAVILVLTMFGGCVALAVLDATKLGHGRHRRTPQVEQIEESSESSDSTETSSTRTPEEENTEFDGAAYMQKITPIIKRAWHHPVTAKPTKVLVVFTVHQTGATSGTRIHKSSGDPACDISALKAIAKASPLPRPGRGAPESFEIEFTFDLKTKNRPQPDSQRTTEISPSDVKRYD